MKRFLVLLSFATAALAAAGPVQTGEPLPRIKLEDQNANPMAFGAETRIIFVAAEMGASRIMAKALEKAPVTVLKDRQAVYIADMSSMPEPISTIVAIPRLQKLPYSVALIRHAADGARWPRRAGAVTVLRTSEGRVRAIEFAHTPEQITSHLR